MSEDPVTRLAKLRMVAESADIEAQLRVTGGCRPVLTVLIKARDKAALAMTALAFVDPGNRLEIQRLQNEIVRFDDLAAWFREIVAAGVEADQEISHDDREEMIDLLSQTTEGQEEAINLGLIRREA